MFLCFSLSPVGFGWWLSLIEPCTLDTYLPTPKKLLEWAITFQEIWELGVGSWELTVVRNSARIGSASSKYNAAAISRFT
jgi:hypothetical protein